MGIGLPPAAPQPFTLDFKQFYAANKPAGSKARLEKLAATRGVQELVSLALVDTLPMNPMLAGDIVLNFEPLILEAGQVEKLGLFLRSTGGVAEIPWRLVSIIRSFCNEFEAIVPRLAMSGACHIAIGADNLVMGPLSSLGSVDPTRSHPLLPRDPQGNPIPVSVQDLKHCLDFLRKNVPKGEAVGPIVSQLFGHISPLAVGALEQSYELSRLITRKVLGSRKKPLKPEHVEKIMDQLAGQYFSHGYFISRDEVEEDLKLPVIKMNPGDGVFEDVEDLNSFYSTEFQKSVDVPGAPIPLKFRITGFLETAKSRRILCQAYGPDGRPVAGDWVEEQNS